MAPSGKRGISRRSIGAEVALVLAVKAAALLVIYLAFFAPPRDGVPAAADAAAAIFGTAEPAR